MTKKKLLLHACCAPCLGYVYELLSVEYDLTVFFFNPNIAPRAEYDRRLAEVVAFRKMKGFELTVGDYNIREWTAPVKEFRRLGERSERCLNCFRFRLAAAFEKARETGIDLVTTTLSVSPHKDASMLAQAGNELATRTGIGFLAADFKKNDGYRKSVLLSREYGFYRQDYCGCVYSRLERRGLVARPASAVTRR